ncbi:IS630 family transposase, partial [Clostridiaceae bacterium]|nr:IS630 family transposase [Clostridiaceae bacterium]
PPVHFPSHLFLTLSNFAYTKFYTRPVIMDNLRTHHCNFVGELIRAKGAISLYLPPYSPDLNPIEKMWQR